MFLLLQFVFCSLLQSGFSLCSKCNGVNVTCVDGECLPRCVSVTSTGECRQCRDYRFYGKQCENDCPLTCLNSTCQMNNSRVVCREGCSGGKKGDSCNVNCPPSCVQCERYGDRCTGPSCASPQYYGDRCDSPCPDNCRGGCNRSGECYSCKPGYYGLFCNLTCPSNCIQCDTGECVTSCPTTGYYGDHCNLTCDGNCNHGCDRNTGVCDYCAVGYRGERCNVPCPFTCTHCDRYSIRCVGPCTNPMYHGDLCDIMCPKHCSSGCDRHNGTCESFTEIYYNSTTSNNSQTGDKEKWVIFWIVIVCGIATAFVMTAIALALILKFRKRLQREKTNDVHQALTVTTDNRYETQHPGIDSVKEGGFHTSPHVSAVRSPAEDLSGSNSEEGVSLYSSSGSSDDLQTQTENRIQHSQRKQEDQNRKGYSVMSDIQMADDEETNVSCEQDCNEAKIYVQIIITPNVACVTYR